MGGYLVEYGAPTQIQRIPWGNELCERVVIDDARTDPSVDAERVYAAPGDAVRAARATIASDDVTSTDRAQALWVLGRTAYYANQMSDAVRLLRDAVPLVDDPELLTEILLTLAPALSKEGHPDEALRMLEDPALELEPRFAGQLRNQRGIILTELNRLPEALDQTQEARVLLHDAGDTHREARALVNLGAIASVMGRLDDAERWYAEALDLAATTGQDVVASAIEGNLGYVESRRGNFAAALDWYGRARRRFDGFEEVGLLEAVLEVDHARTLLDVGLDGDAADAAQRATQSATAGGNRMLETQSRLLLAEALVRLGEHRRASDEIRRGASLAAELGQAAYELRAAALASELAVGEPAGAPAAGAPAGSEMDRFMDAGWVREAYESAIERALRMRSDDPQGARDVLLAADLRTRDLDVDPVVRAFGSLVLADCAGERAGVDAAFDAALTAIGEQRDLVGSSEMRATVARRVGPIRDVALAAAVRSDRAAQGALDVLERSRAVREAPIGSAQSSPVAAQELARLRDARVRLDEAKLSGADVVAAGATVRAIEQDILSSRRTAGTAAPMSDAGQHTSELDLPDGTVYVTYALDGTELLGLVHAAGRTRLVPLGALPPVAGLIRSQRSALRRLADERRRATTTDLERLADASSRLDAALVDPLDVAAAERIVLTPATQLRDIAWGALPSLRGRPTTLTPTMAAWRKDADHVRVRRMAFLGGPGLDNVGELHAVAGAWGRPDAVVVPATCAEAAATLRRADLVHISAHGSFRTDNPFFSSLVFADGHLSVLELTELDAVPAVVMLASCDAGAAAAASTASDPVVVGTANELRRLGAAVVIAPSVTVNDAAAGDFSLLVHEGVADGGAIDDAVVTARTTLLADGEPARVAAALAFQVFGGRATQAPVRRRGGR